MFDKSSDQMRTSRAYPMRNTAENVSAAVSATGQPVIAMISEMTQEKLHVAARVNFFGATFSSNT